LRNIKTNSKISFKKIFKIIFSKPFLGALIFAFALWVYTSLNQEYRTNLNIPIKFYLPHSRAFIASPPENITINVRGLGWQILNSQFRNTAYCSIDLTKEATKDTTYEIHRDLILKNIQNQNYMNVVDVYPDYIKLNTGKVEDVTVELKPNVIITPKEGYTIVGDITVKPDIVFLSGNETAISQIKSWSTKFYTLENVNSPINMPVELSDSLKGVISVLDEPVRLIADIQQIAEIVIPDVKVKIIGSNLLKNHFIDPQNLQVTIRGGINEIKKMNLDQVTAYIDYQQIINDSTGFIFPNVQVPDFLKVIGIKPHYLYHKIKYQ